MKRWPSLLLGLAVLLSSAAQAATATLDVAWWRNGQTITTQLSAQGLNVEGLGTKDASAPNATARFDGSRMVPLGSLWKLFVYLYAVNTQTALPNYRCSGQNQQEVYCCNAGQSIDGDTALAQSCGLFFEPERLRLTPTPWRSYWTQQLGQAPTGALAWLDAPEQLSPERQVRLDSLLQVLASFSAADRAEAEHALLRVVLDGRSANAVRWLGSRLRIKTFSWHDNKKIPMGGGAGWLADGTPVWFAGRGGSGPLLRQWAPQLAQALPTKDTSAATHESSDSGCVVVDYFARYPIRTVRNDQGTAEPGPLQGLYRVTFDNGQAITLISRSDMVLGQDKQGRPTISARLGVNEYVARVLDREASASPTQAARALAIAARSYLQQNAQTQAGCQRMADSSRYQRVSPRPASAAALAIAEWTDTLVVDGVDVRYHRDTPAPNTLAWTRAVALDQQGQSFDDILADAYPRGLLTAIGYGGAPCTRLLQNENWLAQQLPRWQRVLQRQAGYEAPAQPPLICALTVGMPYSEQTRNRIVMRPLASREDRITLAHEYLHLSLRNHPLGQDENHVEQLARRLIDLALERP